jgi:hypothetical protein
MSAPECQQIAEKAEQSRFAFDIIPIQPAQSAIVAIAIIVASLGATELVTHKQHRNPAAQE